jgi:SAM-dependent methyltransferase
VDLGLDRPFRPLQCGGQIGIGQAIDMAEHHRAPVGRWQREQERSPATGRISVRHDGQGSTSVVHSRLEAARQWLVEREWWSAPTGAATQSRPTQVQDDRRQPWPEPDRNDPIAVVPGQCAIGPDERVLGGLLGLAGVAEHPQGDREQPILMGHHEGLESTVEIGGQGVGEPAIAIHHSQNQPAGRIVAPPPIRYPAATFGRGPACDNRATMALDDRFDDLIASLGGFHRSWLVYLGIEAGFFQRLREAGPAGMTVSELATSTGCQAPAVETWAWAADAHDLAALEDDRLTVDADVAAILLDEVRPEYLGGQFVHATVASLDWGGMLQFFRAGTPIGSRPDRYRVAIERLTAQDIAVFFQEALADLPQLVADLMAGGRVVDVHCGGGRWLIAMARRFPGLELVGVEFEEDSVIRARANVAAAGLTDRITIRQANMTQPGRIGEFDLAYFQYALHQLSDAPAVLRAAWTAIKPGGRVMVLDWPLPSGRDEFRTRHGELIAGVQLDELYQGTALATREQFMAWFATADLPTPDVIDLPSGAALFLVERS